MTSTVQSKTAARLREALPNARDLSEAFPAIPPGRVIRCANPSSASADDAEYLLGQLRVRDLIDLRAAEEIREDDPGSALMARTVMQSYRRAWLWPGQIFPVPPSDTPATTSTPSPNPINTQQLSAPPSASAPAHSTSTAAQVSAYDASSRAALSALDAASTAAAADAAAADATPVGARAATTLMSTDPTSEVSAAATDTIPAAAPSLPDSDPANCNGRLGNGAGSTAGACASAVAVRHNISLLDRGRYYLSLASRIPASVTAAALLTNFVSKPAARAMLLPYVNGGGLAMLYEMLLESSRPEIRQVMEVLLRAAESRHCVMFFCRAGKDRTGLVAALVLSVAGATEDEIVEDYARSDAYHRVALAGLESREELAGLDRAQFERAPPEVMRATLDYVRRRYGSISDYLTSIGFGPDRQQRLRELLTAEW